MPSDESTPTTQPGTRIRPETHIPSYPDGRPAAAYRLDAVDHGVVLTHGNGPGDCDARGARDVWVWEHAGRYYLHYDGAGPTGWLACLAESDDLVHWTQRGPILTVGKPGEDDSASASYGVTYFDGTGWHLFYLGTPNTSPAPDRVPAFPYNTMKATAPGPTGPWTKQPAVVPFRIRPDTYYSITASPGHVVRSGDEYLTFFSATTQGRANAKDALGVERTLGIARTQDLAGPWTPDPHPILPTAEQIENSSLYYDDTSRLWFLFTNHIGVAKNEYTDAVWVYWSDRLDAWNPRHKAVVLDKHNCAWTQHCVGLPSVVRVGQRLALFYDGSRDGGYGHMKRDIGLAWIELPIRPPL